VLAVVRLAGMQAIEMKKDEMNAASRSCKQKHQIMTTKSNDARS
jgi:hypothetical protein